jgi:hypothetical protein
MSLNCPPIKEKFMRDIIQVLMEVDCGKHCDMQCVVGHDGYVKWLAKARLTLSDSQIEAVLDAVCCAKTCGIRPATPTSLSGPQALDQWWWWK